MSSRCVFGCRKERSKDLHRFPSPRLYPQLHHAWLQLISNELLDSLGIGTKFNPSKYMVCGRHFEPEAYYVAMAGGKRLQRWAVPKLHLPSTVGIKNEESGNKIVNTVGGEKKQPIFNNDHDYTAPAGEYNSKLQSDDTSVHTQINLNGNGEDTTQVDLTGLIEEACLRDTDKLLINDFAEISEVSRNTENRQNIISQDQHEITETLEKSEDTSNQNLSVCNDLLLNKDDKINNSNEMKTKNDAAKNTLQKSEDTSPHNLSSYDGFISYSDKDKTVIFINKEALDTETLSTNNNITSKTQNVSNNANVIDKSSAGYQRKIKHSNQPKPGRSALISRQETSILSYTRNNCFDKHYVSKKSQAKVNHIKPLQTSKSYFHTENNSLYKQTNTSALGSFKCKIKASKARLLLNLENKNSNNLLKLGKNNLHILSGSNVNSIAEQKFRKTGEQVNSESSIQKKAIANHSFLTNIDSRISIKSRSILKDENLLLHNYTKEKVIQESFVTNLDKDVYDENNLSDNYTREQVNIQDSPSKNTDRRVSVRIYEENSGNRTSGPVSPKRAKLDVRELDEYRVVGSVTVVSGRYEPNEDQPLEDPLAIQSPDLDIMTKKTLIEKNMNIVEDNMSNGEDNISTVEDNMGTVEDIRNYIEDNMSTLEDNVSNGEDNISIVGDNMSNGEDNISIVEDNINDVEDYISTVEDIMGTVEDIRNNIEDNMSTLEDNMNDVEDNISTVKDSMNNINMSIHKNSSLVDSISHKSKHFMSNFDDREEYSDDLDHRLEIAYVLRFIYKEGKTPKEAVKIITEKYGKGKLSLKEAKCWYNEFQLGNNVVKILLSGGPVYK